MSSYFAVACLALALSRRTSSFHLSHKSLCTSHHLSRPVSFHTLASSGGEEFNDFDDFDFIIGDDGGSDDKLVFNIDSLAESKNEAERKSGSSEKEVESIDMAAATSVFKKRSMIDLTATQSRQFSLGEDFILSDFVGNMGFQEVTDWEYYRVDEEDPDNREVVQPNPFDASQPRRTRSSSGSVVRVFRGEFVGRIGGSLSAQGMDRRILIKEFTGEMALQLAQYELQSVGKLQSETMKSDPSAASGDWLRAAASRSAMARTDDRNVIELVKSLRKEPYLGILGEVNLAELDGMDRNEFYRAMGVPPPKPNAVWVVYEYAGLSTISSYCTPPQLRREKLPRKKGIFGGIIEPPPLPSWSQRANYIVKGIMKGSLEALAKLHDEGIVHRSIGRSSLILTTTAMDKREATDVYATRPDALVVKLADFGFSGLAKEASFEEDFCRRAQAFGMSIKRGEESTAAANFAKAEDLHGLGFVLFGLLLSTLVELPRLDYPVPATDEDTLQRQLGEIFDKDVGQFREYMQDEEVWDNLCGLLDERDGWEVLEALFLARERASEDQNSSNVVTARSLLSSPFFD